MSPEDAMPEGLARSAAPTIARWLVAHDGGDVLDVGTGRGDFIATLSEHLGSFSTFTGIDIDQEDLSKASDRLEGKPVRLLKMDGSAMAFEDGSFDTVCISHSLHHLDRVGDVLAEMLRVLRPGGTFILQELYSDGEQAPAQRTEILVHSWSSRVDSLLGTYHRETYTRNEILSYIEPLGLRDVRTLESNHELKCLTCDDRFRCEDPLDPQRVADEIEGIEKDLGRLDECTDRQSRLRLEEEGVALIEMVREGGVLPASILFLMGRR